MNESNSEGLMQEDYSDDSNTQNDDYSSAASDDTAVDEFLSELKNYREKLSAKKKTEAKKFQQSTGHGTKIKNVSKSRKDHKLFDPKLYEQKKKKEDETKNEEKEKKTISRKDYKSMMKRLTENKKDKTEKNQSQSDNKKDSKPENKNSSKTTSQSKSNSPKSSAANETGNSQIFTHLFDQSIEASKKRQKMKEEKDKEEEEQIKNMTQPKTCYQSKVYAHKKVEQYVCDAFDDYNECTEEELITIFEKLGLISKKQNLSSVPDLQPMLDECRITGENEEDVKYKVSPIRTFYLQVARGQCSTPFHNFAKDRLQIAMANEKKQATLDHDPNKQFTTATLLTKETLDRLVPPKQENTQEVKQEEKPDHSFAISEGSKKILNESKNNISTMPIDQREVELMKLKQEKIEKMRDEFRQQLVKDIVKPNPTPQYDEETNQKLAEYKEKKKNYKEPEPPYRPQINDKPPEYKNVNKPNGWDEDIERHKKAQAKLLHLKKLKSGDADYVFQSRVAARMQKNSRPQSASPKSKSVVNAEKCQEETKENVDPSQNQNEEEQIKINQTEEANSMVQNMNEGNQDNDFMNDIHDSDAADAEDEDSLLNSDQP